MDLPKDLVIPEPTQIPPPTRFCKRDLEMDLWIRTFEIRLKMGEDVYGTGSVTSSATQSANSAVDAFREKFK